MSSAPKKRATIHRNAVKDRHVRHWDLDCWSYDDLAEEFAAAHALRQRERRRRWVLRLGIAAGALILIAALGHWLYS